MRKVIIFLLLVLLMISSVNALDSSSNLIKEWFKVGETSATISGQILSSTMTGFGTPTYQYTAFAPNSDYSTAFSGDDYYRCDVSDKLNCIPDTGRDYGLCFWVDFDSPSSDEYVFGNNADGVNIGGGKLYVSASLEYQYDVVWAGGDTRIQWDTDFTVPLYPHLVCVFGNSTHHSLWINDTLVSTVPEVDEIWNNVGMRQQDIGGTNEAGFFDGYLDDWAIFQSVDNSSVISDDMSSFVSDLYTNWIVEEVELYSNDTSLQLYIDCEDNFNDHSYHSDTPTSYTGGYDDNPVQNGTFGRACDLDGSSTGVFGHEVYYQAEEWTMCLWQYWNDSIDNNGNFPNKVKNDESNYFYVDMHDDDYQVREGGGGAVPIDFTDFTITVDGTWLHYCILYNSTHYSSWRDGSTAGAVVSASANGMSGNDGDWDFGYAQYSANRYWGGKFDEFVFYNRTLSQAEIQELYDDGFVEVSDVTAPTITIVSPTEGETYNTVPIWINWTTDETSTCSINSSYWTETVNTGTSFAYENDNSTPDTLHSIEISCNDTSDNNAVETVNFVYDPEIPTITPTKPLEDNSTSEYSLGTFDIDITVDDNYVVHNYTLVIYKKSDFTEMYTFENLSVEALGYQYTETLDVSAWENTTYVLDNTACNTIQCHSESYEFELIQPYAPVITPYSPTTLYDGALGEDILFDIEASDSNDGELITYSWEVDDVEVATDEDYTFSPTVGYIGLVYRLKVTATDDSPFSLTDVEYWNVTITSGHYTDYETSDFTPIVVDGIGTAGAVVVNWVTFLVLMGVLVFGVGFVFKKFK